jgi:hypothetical protein
MKTTPARARTVAHMQRLVATATAATAAAQCSHPDDVKTVTITPLPLPAPTDSIVQAPPPPPTASATLTVPTPPPPPPDPSGYLVVDMLPAPARCLGVAQAAHVTGKFFRDASGIFLEVVVTLTSHNTTFTGLPPTAWSGRIFSSNYRANNTVGIAHVRPQPATGSTALGLTFPVSCGSAGNGSLGVNVSYVGPAADGMIPTLSMHDF